MEIRAACPSDAAAIARVHVDSWRTTYRGVVPDDFLAALSYGQRERMWRGILSPASGSSFVYVAENPGGQVVGFASGGPVRGADLDYSGELYAIYLLPDRQRHGLGRRLIGALVQQLIRADMTSLLVWVLADNPARKFYEALGGQYVYDKQVSIGNARLIEVAYGWRNAHILVAPTQRRSNAGGPEGHGLAEHKAPGGATARRMLNIRIKKDSDDMREEALAGLKRLEELLDTLPIPVGGNLRARIAELRQLLLETRSPRLVLLGRRGAGKSSLINAIFGQKVADVGHVDVGTLKPRWFPYQGELGAIEVLDTRGFQEAGMLHNGAAAVGIVDSVVHACEHCPPDAVLFLAKAKEVRAALDADIRLLDDICANLHARHGYRLPVIGIVTQCDELEPKNVRLHLRADEDGAELEEKGERVREAEGILRAKLQEHDRLRAQLVTVIGLSAYMSWRADGSCRTDERWRIPELMQMLFSELPNEARVEFARISQVKSIQKDIGQKLTMTVAAVCSGIAAAPIPVADIAPITSLQVMLITGIGYVAGRALTIRHAAEMLTAMGVNVGAAFALREAARALIKFVFPGGGNVVSATIAFAGTVGIGRAAVAYFIEGASAAEARRAYEIGRGSGGRELPET